MKHDYAAASGKFSNPENCLNFSVEEYNAIRHALFMMQKLQEPSLGMREAGVKSMNGPWTKSGKRFDIHDAEDAFKAMLEHAEKEINVESGK